MVDLAKIIERLKSEGKDVSAIVSYLDSIVENQKSEPTSQP